MRIGGPPAPLSREPRSAMRPSGVCSFSAVYSASRASPAKPLSPGVTAVSSDSKLTQTPVPFRSRAQVRAKLRSAALVALETLKAGVPIDPIFEPTTMTVPPRAHRLPAAKTSALRPRRVVQRSGAHCR